MRRDQVAALERRRLQSTSPITAAAARARASAIQPQGVLSVDDAGSAVAAVVVGVGAVVVAVTTVVGTAVVSVVVSVSTVVTVSGGSAVVVSGVVVTCSVAVSSVLVRAVNVGVIRVGATGAVPVRAGLVPVRPVPVVSALSPPPQDPSRKPATARPARDATGASRRRAITGPTGWARPP
jgi:hypothetical protein